MGFKKQNPKALLPPLLLLVIASIGLGACKKKEFCVRFTDRGIDCYKKRKLKLKPVRTREQNLELCRKLTDGHWLKAFKACLKEKSCKKFFNCLSRAADRIDADQRRQKSRKPKVPPSIANRPKHLSLLHKAIDRQYRKLLRSAELELQKAKKVELSTLPLVATLQAQIKRGLSGVDTASEDIRRRNFASGITELERVIPTFSSAVRAAHKLQKAAAQKEQAEAAKAGGKAGAITRVLHRCLKAVTRAMVAMEKRHLLAILAMCQHPNERKRESFVNTLFGGLRSGNDPQKKEFRETLRVCYKLEHNPKRKADFKDKLTKAQIPLD
jgi:hypothetical protein